MRKLKISRDKSVSYIQRCVINEEPAIGLKQFELVDKEPLVMYDLKKKQMYGRTKNKKGVLGGWEAKEHLYSFFQNFSVHDIISDEEKFVNIIKEARKWYGNCSSVSTFLSRLDGVLAVESYLNEGIAFEKRTGGWNTAYNVVTRVVSRGLHEYPKNVIYLIHKYNDILRKDFALPKEERKFEKFHSWRGPGEFEVSIGFEREFFEDYTFYDKIFSSIYMSDLKDEQIIGIMTEAEDFSSSFGNFCKLIKEYNYDMKSLLNYVFDYLYPFENVGFSEAMTNLYDYYRMCDLIGRNMKKYPKHLISMHGIVTANYNSFKREYDEVMFSRIIRDKELLAFEKKEFAIVLPENSKDIIKEGTSLNHCVGSYVDRILNKETYICFLRRLKEVDKPLVTLEIKENKLLNAKGSCNREIVKEEKEFLELWCKEKNLEMKI